ncbi:MAG: hypothetical protein HRT36_02495 [Alphaproteobacteria bacterium]|nr:hypothetical protein [Alphaproteobacteria bacterium]
MSAWRQSRTHYNRNGERVTISNCTKDTSAPYSITEDASGLVLAPVVDRTARKDRVYAKLVYTDATNAQIQVRGCGQGTAAHDLQKSHDSCTDKIDQAAKLASGHFKDFYVNNKGTRTAATGSTSWRQRTAAPNPRPIGSMI